MAKKNKKQKYDWDRIRREYSTGQLTVSELARRYSCSRGAIQRRIGLEGWVQDNSREVRRVAQSKLITEDASFAGEKSEEARQLAGCHTDQELENAEERSEIELAAETRVAVLRSHRKDIARLQKLEVQLLDELLDKPQKKYMCNFQGEIFHEDISIPVTERCQAINNLTSATNKRILLERQAFNLNDEENPDDKDLATVILHDPGASDEEEDL